MTDCDMRPEDGDDVSDTRASDGTTASSTVQPDHSAQVRYRFSFMGLGGSGHQGTSRRIEDLLATEWGACQDC